jgi:hypothetical protein
LNRTLFVLLQALFLAILGGTAVVAADRLSTPPKPGSPPAPKQSSAGTGAGPLAAVGSGFTYQGRLKDGGNPANGQYDLLFTLYDDLTAGSQVGVPITVTNQAVTDGLFTLQLDFGSPAFQGSARWLEIAASQAGGGSFTTLSPRQALTAAPYALSLMPGAVITGTGGTAMLTANNGNGNGIYGISNGGGAGVYGLSPATNGYGVIGEADNGANAYGVWGLSTNGNGVYGTSSGGSGVSGRSNSGDGVYGYTSGHAAGVVGQTVGGGNGVFGRASGADAVGVWGQGATGVHGLSFGGGYGVYGESRSTYASVLGLSTVTNGTGVFGVADTGAGAIGVWGKSTQGLAGYFEGNLQVTGQIFAGVKDFKIDDPLDPANKYLYHSSIESSDMMDLYTGNVTTDANGEAWVKMPDWFQALNRDFRYQLTCIGGFAPVYVAQEMTNNSFKIAGAKAAMKISWQVTGIRHDAYASAHPLTVEQSKPANEQGLYLHPELYGQPETKGINYRAQPAQAQPKAPVTKGP